MTKAFLAATLFLFAGSAYAADMPLKAPPAAPPAPTWTGWYIGINGGGGWGRVSPNASDVGPDGFFAPANVPAVVAGASRGFHESGALAGGQVGYLYQPAPGSAIVGLDFAVDWSGLKGTANSGFTPYPVTAPTGFSWNLSAKSQSLFTAVGRIGPDMGTWFPYVSAGAAYSHLTYSATYIDTFYPSTSVNAFSKDAAGFVIGGGAEIRFADHWLLRGEYLHMEFSNITGFGLIQCTPGVGFCAPGGNRTTFQFISRTSEDIGRVALSYKF
jgi:outer membrane immunogenic protein